MFPELFQRLTTTIAGTRGFHGERGRADADRDGNGNGELIALLCTIVKPTGTTEPEPKSWPPPINALMAIYDTDGVAIELDGSECTGEAAFREMLSGLAAALDSLKGTTTKVIVAGDVALTAGTRTADVAMPDGTVVTQSGTDVEVSRRQADGTWRVVIDDPAFV